MTSHPRRAMIVEILHDTLSTPSQFSRAWTWTSRVTFRNRSFLVTQKSMTGAFERDTSRALVEAYLDGTLRSAAVVEETI